MRRFAVEIEGATVPEDLDVHAEAGARRGIARRYAVDGDGTLDVAPRRVVQNPAPEAIEILERPGPCGDRRAGPA